MTTHQHNVFVLTASPGTSTMGSFGRAEATDGLLGHPAPVWMLDMVRGLMEKGNYLSKP